MRRALLFVLLMWIALPLAAGKRRAVRSGSPQDPGTPPVAAADGYVTPRSTNLTVTAPGVLTNDTANGASIASYGKTTGAEQTTMGASTATSQGGSVSLNADGSFTYTPSGSFSGNDTFKYVLTNGAGSSTAEVTVMVIAPPDAVNDAYSTPHNTALNRTSSNGVLANDTLNDGASIASYGKSTGSEQTSIGSNTSTEKNGTVKVNADGSFTYTPASGSSGNDTFKYVLTNGGGSDTATVTINVAPPSEFDFNVTVSGAAYFFTGVSGGNPTLTLERGRTYKFKLSVPSSHPFEIQDAGGSVTNNGGFDGVILTFAVPNVAAEYPYRCTIHDFGGKIVVP